MLQFIQRLLGRSKSQLPPFDFKRNRFRVKKEWPPTLRALTEKQQFRFERKFKRRLVLKSTRPTWNKWTKIVQWSMISFVLVYGVLFHDFAKDTMNPRPGEQPFSGIRAKMWGLWDSLWTGSSYKAPEITPAAPRYQTHAPDGRKLTWREQLRLQQVQPQMSQMSREGKTLEQLEQGQTPRGN
jgi:hypothetical protein